MDERWRVLLAVLGGGLGAAALGAIFGGVTGMLHWRAGKGTGGWCGLRVAAAFEDAGQYELSPTAKGLLVGAVDGVVFLGTLGALVSLAIVLWHPGRATPLPAILGTGLLAVGLLMLGALAFGLVAYCLVRAGSRGIGGPLILAIAGGLVGRRWLGLEGFMLGSMTGLVGGALLTLLFVAPPPSDRR